MELGPFGASEIAVIAALALLLFGPRRLGELGRSAGRTLTRLRRASNELKHAFESELDQAAGDVTPELLDTREAARREASGLTEGLRALEADLRRDWGGDSRGR